MSSPSDTRFAELEAQVASLKTQLAEQREMLATFVLPPELLRASSKGMKGMVEKLLAAGAKAESTVSSDFFLELFSRFFFVTTEKKRKKTSPTQKKKKQSWQPK